MKRKKNQQIFKRTKENFRKLNWSHWNKTFKRTTSNDKFKNKIDTAKETISKIERKKKKPDQRKLPIIEHRKKDRKNTKESLRDIKNRMRRSNIHLIKFHKRINIIFKETMAHIIHEILN